MPCELVIAAENNGFIHCLRRKWRQEPFVQRSRPCVIAFMSSTKTQAAGLNVLCPRSNWWSISYTKAQVYLPVGRSARHSSMYAGEQRSFAAASGPAHRSRRVRLFAGDLCGRSDASRAVPCQTGGTPQQMPYQQRYQKR